MEQEALEEALDLVFHHLREAEEKHPGWPSDLIHGAAIVVEEAGEAIKEAMKCMWDNGNLDRLKEEVAQTAASAVRFLVFLCEESDGEEKRR